MGEIAILLLTNLSEQEEPISKKEKLLQDLFSMYATPKHVDDSAKARRFAREYREKSKGCPMCVFVQKELAKGNEMPVEEWIYAVHLSRAHNIKA